jgi:integrase
MKLTENAEIAALLYMGNEPCIYWGKRGFGLRVYASGAKKYILSYRSSGRKRLLTLGAYPNLSRDKAEDMAASYRLQVSEGSDPVQENRFAVSAAAGMPKPRVTANKTVGALCDAYLGLHASKKRSGYSDERLINRFVRPAWDKLRADTVSRAHVAILHTQVSTATPGQANRLLAVIKTMWKKAAMWGYVPDNHANPAVGVTMNKEFTRERFIKPSELPRLIAAVEQEPDIRVRGTLWLFLLTGARKSELLESTWENVDLERRELRIPKPKQGKPHVYPLSTRAMQVIEQLPRFAGNPYLIPGDKPGRHLVNISKPWNRVRRRAELLDVRLHDLRRSVGSWLAMSGHSLVAIGKVLGHSSPRTTQIYARLTDDVARAALESHSERMMEVLQAASISASSPSSTDCSSP